MKCLVTYPINDFTKPLQRCEDRVGGSGPHEGTPMQIVGGDVDVDFLYQLAEAAEPLRTEWPAG